MQFTKKLSQTVNEAGVTETRLQSSLEPLETDYLPAPPGAGGDAQPGASTSTAFLPPKDSSDRHKAKQTTQEAEEAFMMGVSSRGEKLLSLQQKMMDRLQSSDPERDAFVDWIRSVVMKLHSGHWRQFQHEVSGVMFKYLEEHDKAESISAASSVTEGCDLPGLFQPQQQQHQ